MQHKSLTQRKEINSLKRVFIVGCPRSGTTLLQSMLTTHPSVVSFPESHFFTMLFKRRGQFRSRLQLASRYSRSNFENFLSQAKCIDEKHALPRYALTTKQQTSFFISTLDSIAKKEKKSIWIEKTPDHVKYIDFIESSVEKPLFIHIVRNGPDVVASLFDVTQNYKEEWEGPWDIDKCIRKWISCVENTSIHLNKPNHLLVRYEMLTNEPERVLDCIGAHLEIEFDWPSTSSRKDAGKMIVLNSEPWKANSIRSISKENADKFNQLFKESQKDYILNQLSKVNLDSLNEMQS